ncbi:MAG: enoyl-CoA hydratase-related protein, partial [Bacteriovoracaceae bacterium]|nr:enoyl-CoA hydratase-related protein [Bacteriovoracaceae bacterium]
MNEIFVKYEKTNDGIGKILLSRPELHNAFNEVFIAQFISILKDLRADTDLKVVTLEAEGKSFCAGADLNWMKKMADYSFEENLEDSEQLAELFHQLNSCPVPVLLKLHGHALGGGAGLVACADEVIAAENAELGFTEVRLGLVPAVISPYVIAKNGESHARSTFLSGRRIKSDEALRMGLIHMVVSANELEELFQKRLEDYKASAPKAQRA